MAKLSFSDRIPFFDHFEEIRVRLIRSLCVFLLGFLLCYFLVNTWVLEFLRAPLFLVLPEGERQLYFTGLFENFLTHLKIAAVSAVFLLCPYFFYEIWQFIAPGLHEKEKKYLFPFILLASLFFVGGAAFAYFGLFPLAFEFFVHFGLASDQALLTIGNYYSTVLKLLLLFGLAFELPVFILLLGVLGIVTPELLARQRRNAFLGITIACALFAPPDAISMLLLMIPLYLMYEAVIYLLKALGYSEKEDHKEPSSGQAAPTSQERPGLRQKNDSTKSVQPSPDSVKRKG